MTWLFELIFWSLVGGYDIYLVKRGKLSISKRIEMCLPQWLDVAVVVLILAGVGLFGNGQAFVVALRWIVIGHILLGHETYGK